MSKEKLDEIYSRYKTQIDAIVNLPGMKLRKAGRVIAWFYGGTEDGWRKLLSRRVRTSRIPKEVSDLLVRLGTRK